MDTERKDLLIEDERLEPILNAVDERTTQLERLHDSLSDGFMSLAREKYRDPTSIERLSSLVYDERDDLEASVLMDIIHNDENENEICIQLKMEGNENNEPINLKKENEIKGLRRRRGNKSEKDESEVDGVITEEITKNRSKGRNNLIAIPSAEIRDVMKHFHVVIDHAIEVVNMTSKLNNLIDRENVK